MDNNYLSREEFEGFERSVSRSFDEVGKSLSALSSKIDQLSMRGTDWKSIFAGLSLFTTIVLAIGGIIAWGLNSRLDSNYMRLERAEMSINEMAASRWTREEHDRYRDSIQTQFKELRDYSDENRAQLDDVLQREMRLLDATLQREIRTLMDAPAERHNALEARVDRIEKEQAQRTKRVYGADE